MPTTASHDHPLPGDLLVKRADKGPVVPSPLTYLVMVYPNAAVSAGQHQSLDTAIRRARELANKRGTFVQVWRDDGDAKPGYKNVTEQTLTPIRP